MQYPYRVTYSNGGKTAHFHHGKIPVFKTKQPQSNRRAEVLASFPKYPVGKKVFIKPSNVISKVTRVRGNLGFVEIARMIASS